MFKNQTTMNKTYIAPSIEKINVKQTILAGSLAIDPEKETSKQYSKHADLDFEDDEDEE